MRKRPSEAARLLRLVAFCVLVFLIFGVVAIKDSLAEQVAVPVPLQAALLAKVAAYDKGLPGRVVGQVRVLVLTKGGDPYSERVASQMQSELGQIDRIAGLPHVESVEPFRNAAALATECQNDHVAIIYFAPHLEDELPGIATALNGVDVLTAAPGERAMSQGSVLAFDLFQGKPKLFVNLAQATRQKVSFKAAALQMMKVAELEEHVQRLMIARDENGFDIGGSFE